MVKAIRVFVDSDVVVSAIISQTGAAHLIMNDDRVGKFISNFSIEELNLVIHRLKLSPATLKLLLDKAHVIDIKQSKTQVKQRFSGSTNDENDAHVVAGTVVAKAKFLLTYNQKHYNTDQIKNELGITVLTPALFLQYRRSLER